MMARKRAGLSERHKKILKFLKQFQAENGYPPSIREIGENTDISSTSVVNYYLKQLEEMQYIERENNVSRGIRLLRNLEGNLLKAAQDITEMFSVPVIGRIVAGEPVPVPSSDFNYFDSETGIDIARSLLPPKEKTEDLFALEVQGDSMIDAMVNDGDIVIMRPVTQANNGEMVAVWLADRDETTLKYFYLEGGHVRLQPANPLMKPIIIDDPTHVQVQGKVVLVIRRLDQA
ncbi:MAG TPA: transcriptional repressor LexA [Brevefilum sp.]|nr:transcriptional repressor LexA [Brevefilum sp.]HOR19625.1 transcriptional repressor LexA [Brevefilum sp.]HPL70229.1 transcriptional repressor LexA [Brevefilum sp.]